MQFQDAITKFIFIGGFRGVGSCDINHSTKYLYMSTEEWGNIMY